jgi:hypothetical protein
VAEAVRAAGQAVDPSEEAVYLAGEAAVLDGHACLNQTMAVRMTAGGTPVRNIASSGDASGCLRPAPIKIASKSPLVEPCTSAWSGLAGTSQLLVLLVCRSTPEVRGFKEILLAECGRRYASAVSDGGGGRSAAMRAGHDITRIPAGSNSARRIQDLRRAGDEPIGA